MNQTPATTTVVLDDLIELMLVCPHCGNRPGIDADASGCSACNTDDAVLRTSIDLAMQVSSFPKPCVDGCGRMMYLADRCGYCTMSGASPDMGEVTQDQSTTTYRKGEQVRYIGQNAEYGNVGTVRATEVLGGEVKADVCFPARGKRCGFRRLIAPENLQRLSA